MANLTGVNAKIAAAILLSEREISMRDIRALPFVETDNDAEDIVGILRRSFDLDVVQRRDPTERGSAWEDVWQLREAA